MSHKKWILCRDGAPEVQSLKNEPREGREEKEGRCKIKLASDINELERTCWRW